MDVSLLSVSSASTRYTVALLTLRVAAIVDTGSPLACIRRASAAFDWSSALGRPIACPRARRASRAAARRSRPNSSSSSARPGEQPGHHAFRCSRTVYALPQGAQHDVTVAQLANRRHDFRDVLHSDRFVDMSPAEVWATLLDEGVYLGSQWTFYIGALFLSRRHGHL